MNFVRKSKKFLSTMFIVAVSSYIMITNIGCASSQNTVNLAPPHEIDLGTGRIGILEPEMFLYDVSEGGVLEYRDDWSGIASRATAINVALMFQAQGYSPVIIPDPHRTREFFLMTTSMRLHSHVLREEYFTRGRSPFAENLNFNIGSISELSDYYNVDGFLFIYGFQEHFSAERRNFVAENNLNIGERTHVAALLAKKCGRVTWYSHIIAVGDVEMEQLFRIAPANIE